jgi:hypothetical protein
VAYVSSHVDEFVMNRPDLLAMNRLGVLLGSTTRGNLVEVLALSDRGLTAY